MNRIQLIQLDCTELLNQLKNAIQLLPDEYYSRPSAVLDGSSLGMHVRHVLEFFLSFQKGLTTGIIDYDSRERDIRVENERNFALEILNNITENLNYHIEDKTVQVLYQGNQAIPMTSSLSRELTYNLEHCVHHMAILKIGIHTDVSPNLLPSTFGVAASTLKYRENTHVHGKLSA